jgi:hypothetical protein
MNRNLFLTNVPVIAALLFLSACTPAMQGPIPTTSPGAITDIPDLIIPTVTSLPATETSIPDVSTVTPVASPASWKEGWVDFTNSYYGYTISLPTSAIVRKNEEVESYDPNELPAGWNEKDNYFDYLNRTYPPGLCVSVESQGALIQIKVADDLGGKYVQLCSSFGGLGDANWLWTEENVTVGETDYTATVVRQCDAQNQNCGNGTYGIRIGDGAGFVLFNVGPDNQEILFEILRSYRPASRTELYCPRPAPARLEEGGYAFVSTDPPLAYNNVRSAPGINQELIEKIAPGEVVELLDGPVCNNSLQWWKIRLVRTGLVGWTPEGDHKAYWLKPCESEESCGIP